MIMQKVIHLISCFTLALALFCSAGVFGFSTSPVLAESIEDIYQAPDAFIANSFDGTLPESKVLWLNKEQRTKAADILTHRYAGMRVRYWQDGARTAWILEEIGKVKPITTGLLIENGQLLTVAVLIYRESHGYEVRYPSFTDQFQGAKLKHNSRLNTPIHGISGATLSVNAVKRLARLALYFDRLVHETSGS